MDTHLRRALLEPSRYHSRNGAAGWALGVAEALDIAEDDVIDGLDELVEEGLLRKMEYCCISTTNTEQTTVVNSITWARTEAGASALQVFHDTEAKQRQEAKEAMHQAFKSAINALVTSGGEALLAWFVETEPHQPQQRDIIEITGLSRSEVRGGLKTLQASGLVEHVPSDICSPAHYQLAFDARVFLNPYIRRAHRRGVSPLSLFG